MDVLLFFNNAFSINPVFAWIDSIDIDCDFSVIRLIIDRFITTHVAFRESISSKIGDQISFNFFFLALILIAFLSSKIPQITIRMLMVRKAANPYTVPSMIAMSSGSFGLQNARSSDPSSW